MSGERLVEILSLLPEATFETVYMTFASTAFACVLGFPLGIYLYVASPAGLAPGRVAYGVLSQIVNLFRSIPFIILMVLLVPLTRIVVGTSIGPTAAISRFPSRPRPSWRGLPRPHLARWISG